MVGVVTFSHGWPLNSGAWDGQLHFIGQNGFRVVAHDRRGHGPDPDVLTPANYVNASL
jgi:pimeloyl-ACP methyl ester carboxylesterase